MVRCLIGAGVAASVFLGPGAGALAQDQGESARTGREIETIVVTARKKEESIRETPISITAFSGDTLQRTGVTDIADVALRTPSLSYGDFGDEKLSPVSLRGEMVNSLPSESFSATMSKALPSACSDSFSPPSPTRARH